MNTEIFDTYEAMCSCVADEIIEQLNQNPRQLLCIAAGHTSLGVFKCLVTAFNEGRADFSKASFVAMDEWLHMSANTKESCGYFIHENFLKYVNYAPENVRLWDGTATDPQKECADVERFIARMSHGKAIDYLVLGMGMNGHLALNEPGTSFEARAHVTKLDPVTQKVGQKYFTDTALLSGGITLGIANFREAARTVLMVNGASKANILAQVLNASIPDEQLPATALLDFNNTSLYCDRAACPKTHD